MKNCLISQEVKISRDSPETKDYFLFVSSLLFKTEFEFWFENEKLVCEDSAGDRINMEVILDKFIFDSDLLNECEIDINENDKTILVCPNCLDLESVTEREEKKFSSHCLGYNVRNYLEIPYIRIVKADPKFNPKNVLFLEKIEDCPLPYNLITLNLMNMSRNIKALLKYDYFKEDSSIEIYELSRNIYNTIAYKTQKMGLSMTEKNSFNISENERDILVVLLYYWKKSLEEGDSECNLTEEDFGNRTLFIYSCINGEKDAFE